MSRKVILAPQLFDAIARLTANEQARAIDFIRTFQDNPAHPGLKLHPITATRSSGMWSGRITRDLRAILHKDGDTWALLHADHHDAAYAWAERRDIGRHPVTGALQIVEAIETVREVERTIEVEATPDAPPLFAGHEDDYLLSLGVPETWLPTLRRVQNEDQLFTICERLPAEVGERLLSLAAGELVTPPAPVPADRPVLEAPDTRGRFYVVEGTEGLVAALQAPMDRWLAFLHPSQRALVERDFRGPARVSGSAGTGKTVVAMHRARHLARRGERVLLTSFVSTLCDNLARNLGKLCAPDERERITVSTVHKQALELLRRVEPDARPASDDDIAAWLDALRIRHAPAHDPGFVRAEWENVIRLQGIGSWSEYRRARRSGRGRGLSVKERKLLWQVFGGVLDTMVERQRYDWPGMCQRARTLLAQGAVTSPFTAVIVDEAQDLKPPELRFLAALCAAHPGHLMLCGDAGQRIYPGGFSLAALGIDVRGRATILRINYRTTEQIRRLADRVLGDPVDDMDGDRESRAGTRSLLRGPQPVLRGYPDRDQELTAAADQVRAWLDSGLQPEAIGVFARTGGRVTAFGAALDGAGIPWRRLSDKSGAGAGAVHVGTMHRAKGLEFKAVLVLDASDGVLPSPGALRNVDDPLDREAALDRERRLLYVAMTRARDELCVTWSGAPSPFVPGQPE